MNRLAAEFFAAVPAAQEEVPEAAASRDSGGLEHAPRVDVPASSSAAPAVPGAATAGNPDATATSADLFGFAGLESLPTAEPYAAGLPSIPQPPLPVPGPPIPVPTPSTPFYFLAESNPYREEVQRTLGDAQADDPRDDRVASADPGAPATAPGAVFDVRSVRRDFPILAERVNGKPLVWLDNAATTQKPQAVVDRLAHFYRARELQHPPRRARAGGQGDRRLRGRPQDGGAVPRAPARRRTSSSSAAPPRPSTWWPRAGASANVRRGDEIVISHLEHHANIVPWQQLIAETGAKLRVIPVDDSGQLHPRRVLPAAVGPDENRCRHACLERARHRHPGRSEVVEMGHRAGCLRADRRGPVGAAPAGEHAVAGRGLLRLLRAQDLRSDRDRCASTAGRRCWRRCRRGRAAAT